MPRTSARLDAWAVTSSSGPAIAFRPAPPEKESILRACRSSFADDGHFE